MLDKTALKAEFSIKTIEGRIRGFVERLYQLAPHPRRPDHRGPLFISLNSAFKPAAEYDGMLGNLMMESFLGAAFGDAVNDNHVSKTLAEMGWSDALSEYSQYQAEKKNADEKGRGSFSLGEHKTICNQFEQSDASRAFFVDLTEREAIEQTIAGLSREIDAIKGLNNFRALTFAA